MLFMVKPSIHLMVAIITSSFGHVFCGGCATDSAGGKLFRPDPFRKRVIWQSSFIPVMGSVLRMSYNLQVVGAVIKSIAISMVYMFFLLQFSTQQFFCNNSVLIRPSSAGRNLHNPVIIFTTSVFSSGTNWVLNQLSFSHSIGSLFYFFFSPFTRWRFTSTALNLRSHSLALFFYRFRGTLMTLFKGGLVSFVNHTHVECIALLGVKRNAFQK